MFKNLIKVGPLEYANLLVHDLNYYDGKSDINKLLKLKYIMDKLDKEDFAKII